MNNTPPSRLTPNDVIRFKKYLIDVVSRSLEGHEIPAAEKKKIVRERLNTLIEQSRFPLPPEVRKDLIEATLNDIIGYGPIQPLLEDNEISEIMVNGPKKVYIEKKGMLQRTNIAFDDDEHVIRIIERIVLPLGRRIDAEYPMVDARLPDGSRVNAVIPPVAIDGPSLTIRKFRKDKLRIEQLIQFGSLNQGMAEFLRACVAARLNIIISGGTGSGKTTLLNVLSSFIPENERIVTIEDAAELQLQQDHVVRLEARPPDLSGKGGVTIRDLVRNALRMRPDRIVVGECRGGEALDMLQAMNTGHDGSMTTIHANSPRDALARLETLVLMAGMDLPLKVVRQQIASAVDLIIQQSRLRDGSRKIVSISEIVGMEGEVITMSELFKFEQTGIGPSGKIIGTHKATGLRPMFSSRLEAAGFKLDAIVFGANPSAGAARK